VGLCTTDEARAEIGDDTIDETMLQRRIDAATVVIEDITGPIAAAAKSKTYDGDVDAVLLPSDATAIVSVTENGQALGVDEYTADLAAGIVYAGPSRAPRPFFPGRQNVVVTYSVGSQTVPENVHQAALELVTYWWRTGQQGSRPAWDQTADGEVYTPSGYPIPRSVFELCAPNPRMPGFA
jgi:hypothetical protein